MQAVKRLLAKLFAAEDDPVHTLNDVEELTEELQDANFEANSRNEQGDTPLHLLAKRSFKKHKLKLKAELLVCMLTYSKADVDIPDNSGNTPLHTVVKAGEMEVVRAIVAFNANINALNNEGKTPLDLAPPSSGPAESDSDIASFLVSCGAKHSASITPRQFDFSAVVSQKDTQDLLAQALSRMETDLREKTKEVLSSDKETFGSAKEMAMLVTELEKLKKGGGRVLCLDGGGIRGLIQMEVLSQLERKTGRKVTELFDWIVGTSTGGVVALGLVYAKMTLHELRQFFFKTRYEVFGDSFKGIRFDTDALIDIYQGILGNSRMNDVKSPKVLISAVDKSCANLKLRFFNNCFDDDYSHQEAWKVARYTSAAPAMFKEMDDFVDGGLLAQNPSTLGVAKIREHHQIKGQKVPLSLVLSIGTGIPPHEELGSVDAQDFVSFGLHWLDREHKNKFGNLLTLMGNALVHSDGPHFNTRITCADDGISYFRFDPQLSKDISSGETDFDNLLLLMLDTKTSIGKQVDELVKKLYQSVEAREQYLKEMGIGKS